MATGGAKGGVRLSLLLTAIFKQALDSARVEASQTVFIDNDRQNIAVASAAGLHAIYFDDSTNDVGGLTSQLRTEFRLL